MASGARDTIYALASGALPSGIAVVRVSGPAVGQVLEDLTGGRGVVRQARLATIRDSAGTLLDTALVVRFGAPASFTGEDVCEFHIHGGRAVLASVLEAFSGFDGLRAAEAGEFTRRAFLNGKIDLTRAEALADLIEAETKAEQRLALESAAGSQHRLYSSWRATILSLRASIEADLDFADEEDVPEGVAEGISLRIGELRDEIEEHFASYEIGRIAREGFRVVIAGPPNAGKSTLLNHLAQRDVAIVTEHPGTTRDLLEVVLEISGRKIIVTDTAGLRDAEDAAERIGVERAHRAAREADLVLVLHDPSSTEYDHPVETETGKTVLIASKSDLWTDRHQMTSADFTISTHTGDGIAELIDLIGHRALEATPFEGRTIATRMRHVELLRQCVSALGGALKAGDAVEIRAEELRRAGEAMGRITGEIGTEEVLGEIFSRFCIGK